MKLTHHGHACFSVSIPKNQKNRTETDLLFDPFLSSNPLAKAARIRPKQLSADYVLISHGHFDHVEDAVSILKRTGAKAIVGFEVGEWLKSEGVESSQVLQMNHGGTLRLDFGTVKMVSAIHSSTLPSEAPGGSPAGFVIRCSAGAFYYSGDTALTLDMQLIPKQGALNFAILCIGDTFTMGPEDALEAAKFVKCSQIVGVHHGTWPVITIDESAAQRLFRRARKKLHLPKAGETIRLT